MFAPDAMPAFLCNIAPLTIGVSDTRAVRGAQGREGGREAADGGWHSDKGGTHPDKVPAPFLRVGTPFLKGSAPFDILRGHPADGGAQLDKVPAHLPEVGAPISKVGAPIGKVSAPVLKVGTPFLKVGAPIARVGPAFAEDSRPGCQRPEASRLQPRSSTRDAAIRRQAGGISSTLTNPSP